MNLGERLEHELEGAREVYHRARAAGTPPPEIERLVRLGRELKETIAEIDHVETKIERDVVLYRVHLVTKGIALWSAKHGLGPRDPFADFGPPPLAAARGGWKTQAEVSNRCCFKHLRTPIEAQALAAAVIAGGRGRAKAAQMLAQVVCGATGLAVPRVRVLERPRAHTVRAGRVTYEIHGDYGASRSDSKLIRIYNRTARKGQEVAGKTFLDTLVHELCHHADVHVLGLNLSPHCEGFFARIAHVVRSLRGLPLTGRPESYHAVARRRSAAPGG